MDMNFADDIIKKALSKGCDSAEVFIKNAQGVSAEVKGGEVEAMEAAKEYGIGIKVIRDQKLGFSFTTSPDDINSTIDKAVMSTEWTSKDVYIDIPDHAEWKNILICDEKIRNVKETDVIDNAMLLEKSALDFDKRIKKVRKASVSAGTSSTVIVNSKGVNVSYESTYYSASVTTLAQDESGDSQMGWDFAASRRMQDIDVTSIGKTASKRATELLSSRKISSVKVPVILSPSVAIEFLEILSVSLSAEAVQKKRSFLMGKTGETVTSTLIDIIDDGTMQWSIGTRPADDEGVPVTKKNMISQGVLNSYFHNTYTAKKAGVRSTGNAMRSSYKNLPSIGVTNLYIKASDSTPTKSSLNKGGQALDNYLIKSLSKGIIILSAMGVHTANPVSGDFSIGISGLWVEKGEILYPVKEAVISGNVLEMFRKVDGIGNDLTFYGNMGSPSLLVGDMDISA